MEITITLFDYRCFSAAKPVTLTLRPGRQAFVGLNNTGKSALLRMLYELRPLWGSLAGGNSLRNFLSNPSASFPSITAPTGGGNLPYQGVMRSNSQHGRMQIKIEVSQVPNPAGITIQCDSEGRTAATLVGYEELSDNNWTILQDGHVLSNRTAGGATVSVNYSDLAAAGRQLVDAFYLPSTRYVTGSNAAGQQWFDIRAGSQVVTRIREMESSKDRRRSLQFETITREIGKILGFNDFRVVAIPDENRFDLELSVNGDRRPIDEFGSGIAQFVLAAFSLVDRKPTFLLVDEPESNLHPALQAKYLDLIASQASVGTLIATHSLGLARHTCEKVWIVRHDDRVGASVVEPLNHPLTPVEILRDLQYGAISSVGMNRILLVEGPTDAGVAREWLRVLGLDTSIMVAQLGGSNQIHGHTARNLDEFKRTGVPVACFVDSDRTSEGSPLRQQIADFEQVCKQLKIDCLVCERRSIENYIPQRALDAAHPKKNYKEIGPFDDPKQSGWKGQHGWLAAREMTREEVLATDIGQFLNKLRG